MNDGRSFWFSDHLRGVNLPRSELRGGGHSDSSDSSDRAAEVFYDHRSGLPQHEPTDTPTARSGDGLAHQSLRFISGNQQQQQQQQPPTKQVSAASLTSSLDVARKGGVDSFPASTLASTAPGATLSAFVGTVNEAVVTMNHAVRVPSALRGAGRRTMFDVLVDVAAQQRRQEQRRAKPQESAEGTNFASKPSPTTRDAQVLDVASSAREVTYQMLFPRTVVAAAAARMSSSCPTTFPPAVGSAREPGKAHTVAAAPLPPAAAVVPPSPSGSERIHTHTSPVSHLSPPPPSPPPPERAKPDRRLRHLLPAHLRGCPAASQSADDSSQRQQLQAAQNHEAKSPQTRHADHRTGASALDASDISSISSCSDGDTTKPNTRHPLAPPAVARPTVLSRLIDGDAEELVRLSHHRGGRDRGEPERPQAVAIEPKTNWALLERVLMGTAGAVASTSHAGGPKRSGDRHRRRRRRHHRVGRTTTSGSSERGTTHSRTTDASTSDRDDTSSGVEDSGHDSGGVVDLRRDLDDEVPQWVRQHEAARERLAQLQQQQRQQFSWASPTFSNAHMFVTARAAAADKAQAQVAATAAASQAFFGKPRSFCPSSMAPRTPSAASYAASGLVGGGAPWSAVSGVGQGRHDTWSPLTAAATAAGVPRSLLAFGKEGKRVLRQRSSNATAVAVVEYLWQRFQAWKPCGLRLLHQLRSGFCFCEAAAPPAGSSLSRAEHGSGPDRLLVNPVCNDAAGDADGPIEDISGTSSDEGSHASAVQSKAARKPRRVSNQALPQRRPRGTAGGGADATHRESAQNKDQGKAGDAAAAVAEADGSSDEGIELQMKVHYMESAFNVVAVHGELTYASEGACARLGLVYPLPPFSPCLSPRVSSRADDAETTPAAAAQQRRWTFLVPEPALTQVPVRLQEHLYLAEPYTVLHEMQTVLSSYNFTTDALLRQHAEEEEAAQEERQRWRALDASNVAGVATQKTNASSTTAAVAGRAAANDVLEGHMLDRGDGESGGRQRGVSPTRSGSLCNGAAANAPTHWRAALEGNDETPVREAASIHAQAPADHADAPVANRSPTSLRRELGGAPVNLDPTRLGRAPPLQHPQRRQWLVEDGEDNHLRAHSADGEEAHTPTAVRQCGSGCVGASPEPHQPPVSRFPPPPPRLRDAGNGSAAVNAEAQCPKGVPPGQSSVSPSYVRTSTASVNSISIDGFYDPLAMPALPTTGVKRGIAAAWGANERWGHGGGSGTNGSATATADKTMVLTGESGHGADREIVPEDAFGRGLAAGPRELPIPPQMTARPTNSLRSSGAAELAAGVFGGLVGEDARVRGGNALAREMSTVTAAAIAADPLMDDRVGGGFPRGPAADWDIPVDVLFALSGGGGQGRERSEQPVRHRRRRHRDAEVGSGSAEDDDEGAPMVQQGLAGARRRATTSARLAQEPVHAYRRHRHETRASDGAFQMTALGEASSELDSAAASQLASQKIPQSATFSLPTPCSRFASAASSLVSSAAPSSSSPSSLSEPEDGDGDDDDVKGGGTAHAAREPSWKANAKGAVRWPRHGTRRSGRDGVFVTRQQQQQQQERWIRELWGRGKQDDEPSVLPAAPSTVSAPAHAPAGPSQYSQHQQQTSPSQRPSMLCTSTSLFSAVDASISVLSAVSASARAAPITRETGGNGAMNTAPPSSPLPDEDSAAMAPHVDTLTSLSSLEAIVRGVPTVPVLHHAEVAGANTATTGFFALEDVDLSDAD